jgi:prepilin-type N-terminal cleavage/methylation domain-containing protein/prepilin-type processing-associated H-X9-DG protein
MKRRQRRDAVTKAFTLVELLVVIAIIAILASLLAGGIAKGKAAADSAVCKNNLHQLDVAVRMYVNACGAYPTVRALGPPPYPPTKKLPELLEPYLDGATVDPALPAPIHVCPGYRRVKGVSRGTLGSYGYNINGRFSYVGYYHGDSLALHSLGLGGRFMTTDNGLTRSLLPTLEEFVVKPSDMVEIGDTLLGSLQMDTGEKFIAGFTEAFSHDTYAEPFGDELALSAYRNRHGGRWNVSFCDGHIENLRTKQLFDPKNDFVYRRWNCDYETHRYDERD